MATYTRLSALDRSFLDIENRNTHMHVGATCVFDVGPLRHEGGGIDIDRVRSYVESRLHLIPRYRQRIAHVPLEGHPVWVDDDQFDIRYHVRHLSIPKPGCERELKRLAGWINSQQLDRHKPLWEMWVVEGLENDRFAMIAKTHHCMVDGMAGADLLAVLLKPSDDTGIDDSQPWRPRPAPAPTEMLRDSIRRYATLPLRTLATFASDPAGFGQAAVDLASALYESTSLSIHPASDTPLNRSIGSHRRFDWLCFDLDRVKAVKNRLGGTVNDVVLNVVAGGVRDYFAGRGIDVDAPENTHFRVFCPVGIHTAKRGSTGGNFVSAMMTELPVGEPDPLARLAAIRDYTREHKGDATVRGTEILEKVADETIPQLIGLFAWAVETSRTYNMVVTNVPGPPFPLYLLGARMHESFPLVPLFGHQGIGIALLSYNNRLCWGFSADRDIVHDLHDFVECVRGAFAEICAIAGLPAPRSDSILAPRPAAAFATAAADPEPAAEAPAGRRAARRHGGGAHAGAEARGLSVGDELAEG